MTDAELLAGFVRDMARDAIETHGEQAAAYAALAVAQCKAEEWSVYEELWTRIGKATEVLLVSGEETVH